MQAEKQKVRAKGGAVSCPFVGHKEFKNFGEFAKWCQSHCRARWFVRRVKGSGELTVYIDERPIK
jgi:hypothetical protein